MSSVTLKQIAEQAGVSITTVHRVLNGKEGCSPELKDKILGIAQEQGYTVNYAAASVRKHSLYLCIALVFPANSWGYNWYLQSMLDGYLTYRREVSKYNIVFQEYYYQSASDSAQILQSLYADKPVPCDGVVLYDINPSAQTVGCITRLLRKGIPVVVLEKSAGMPNGICRVQIDDRMTGRMAAQLMTKFVQTSGSVAVLCQSLQAGDTNGEAFAQEVETRCPELKVQMLRYPLMEVQPEEVSKQLAAIQNLVGVYATCARHTATYLRLVQYLPRRPVAIGSELFAETRAALYAGTLDAVIDKRPFSMGYQALDKLFHHVVKDVPLPAQWDIVPRIILQANCDAYYLRKETSYGINSQTG